MKNVSRKVTNIEVIRKFLEGKYARSKTMTSEKHMHSNAYLLYSFCTIIAVRGDGQTFVNNQYYSDTTRSHVRMLTNELDEQEITYTEIPFTVVPMYVPSSVHRDLDFELRQEAEFDNKRLVLFADLLYIEETYKRQKIGTVLHHPILKDVYTVPTALKLLESEDKLCYHPGFLFVKTDRTVDLENSRVFIEGEWVDYRYKIRFYRNQALGINNEYNTVAEEIAHFGVTFYVKGKVTHPKMPTYRFKDWHTCVQIFDMLCKNISKRHGEVIK